MAGSTKLRLLESAITFLRRVLKPKSVIRPFYVLFYNCLQYFGFYKLSFVWFLIRNSSLLLIKNQTKSILLKIQNPSKP